MRRNLPAFLVSVLCALALVFSACDSGGGGGGGSSTSPQFGQKSGISIRLPSGGVADSRSAESYTRWDTVAFVVSISSSNYKDSKSAMPDSTVEFTDIPVGNYTVTIDGKDSKGKRVSTGFSTAKVLSGKSTAVSIKMKTLDFYEIHFLPNGGGGTMDMMKVTVGDDFKLPECEYTAPIGKKFAGWAVGADKTLVGGTNKVYELYDSTEFYALWISENSYVIEYENIEDANASADGPDLFYEFGTDENIVLPVMVKTGYTFEGWHLNSASGVTINGWNAGQKSSDIKLYAVWSINSYTVKFMDSDGSELSEPQTVNYRSNVTKPTGLSKAGYNFVGWSTKVTEFSAFDFSSPISSNLTLTAFWAEQDAVSNVVFSVAGQVAYNTSLTLSCETAGAAIYYTTDGTVPTAESTAYTAAIHITGNMTVKAIAMLEGYLNSVVSSESYTLAPVTVTYVTDYGTAPNSVEIEPNSPITVQNLPVLESYGTFDGWKNGSAYVNASSVFTEDVTLTAAWNTAGKIILTSENYENYIINVLTNGMELCIDKSISSSTLDNYFRYIINDNKKNITINMKYYTNLIESLWFYNAAGKIILPDNLTALSSQAFQSASDLVEISISPVNSNYCTEDGVLYDKSKTTMVKYPQNKSGSSFNIPAGVTTVGYGVFEGVINLEYIPNFNQITTIKSNTMQLFARSSIKTITFNDSITKIPEYTFKNAKLEEITLPSSLTSIGFNSFTNCTNLKKVVFKSSAPPKLVSGNSMAEFYGCTNADLKIYVPSGAKTAYSSNSYWTSSATNALSNNLSSILVGQ